MAAKVIVVGPRDPRPPRSTPKAKGLGIADSNTVASINTTSRSNDFGKGLSPFFLGPVKLSYGHSAKNVENGWQYSKVYAEHLDSDGDAGADWWAWAEAGWAKDTAVRYPMGKGSVPEFSFWDGNKLSYIEARARIYIPLYAKAVRKTEAFAKLREIYRTVDTLYLWDFDGYDHRAYGLSLMEVPFQEDRKMGHAFVLAMMLQFGPNFYKR